jgi:hypothetical protein
MPKNVLWIQANASDFATSWEKCCASATFLARSRPRRSNKTGTRRCPPSDAENFRQPFLEEVADTNNDGLRIGTRADQSGIAHRPLIEEVVLRMTVVGDLGVGQVHIRALGEV